MYVRKSVSVCCARVRGLRKSELRSNLADETCHQLGLRARAAATRCFSFTAPPTMRTVRIAPAEVSSESSVPQWSSPAQAMSIDERLNSERSAAGMSERSPVLASLSSL